jgi:Zn-dependent protease with chaperone function
LEYRAEKMVWFIQFNPHPLYAAFYYSHPPVVERVRRLQGKATAAAGDS